MVEFTVFDSILDAAFVVDQDGRVVYLNDPAANFCRSSVRRVTGKALISDLFTIQDQGILPFTAESRGRTEPTPFIETTFSVPKADVQGTCQLAVRPLGQAHWAFFVRDVSLEEALHSKYRSELSQKEDYARNLEKLVEARTAELNALNKTLNAILDSLGQGFFTFDAEGTCGPVFTKACETVLEGSPKGRVVADVLAVPEAELKQFNRWKETLFMELLPFEDLKPLGTTVYPHSGGRHVTLDYYPLRREDQTIAEVVVVATDRTAEVEAQLALEIERQYASMIVKYTKNKDQFLRFLASVRPALDALIVTAGGALDLPQVNEAFRVLHTLEGEAAAFSLRELRQATRDAQVVLEPLRAGAAVDDVTRARLIASLRDTIAGFELFLNENQDVIRLPSGEVGRSVEISVAEVETFLAVVRALPGGPAAAAPYAERLLTEPIEGRLRYFDGLTSSVAEKLGKRIHPLKITGGDLRIHPEPFEPLFASLVHAFRNAIDHGLEDPTEREWAGKDPAGTIRVNITNDADHLRLDILDDGRGIDPAVIRRKLAQKFPNEDSSQLSDQDVIQSVCRPGFSSRDQVGEFSGRGVGLDALREEVLRLGGEMIIKSKLGEGMSIELTIPYARSVIPELRSA